MRTTPRPRMCRCDVVGTTTAYIRQMPSFRTRTKPIRRALAAEADANVQRPGRDSTDFGTFRVSHCKRRCYEQVHFLPKCKKRLNLVEAQFRMKQRVWMIFA